MQPTTSVAAPAHVAPVSDLFDPIAAAHLDDVLRAPIAAVAPQVESAGAITAALHRHNALPDVIAAAAPQYGLQAAAAAGPHLHDVLRAPIVVAGTHFGTAAAAVASISNLNGTLSANIVAAAP